MSDTRLRELERSAAQGDGRARRDLLVARLRAGAVDRDRLELLAWLGEPSAQEVLGASAPVDIEAWVAGLARWGVEPAWRAAVALGWEALAAWEAWEAGEFAPSSQVRAALEAVEAAGAAGQGTGGAPRADAHEALAAAEQALDGASALLAFLEAEHGLDLEAPWRAHQAGLATLAAARAGLLHLDGEADPASGAGAAAREVAWIRDAESVRVAVRARVLAWAERAG